jgi:signal transduction histidine kinase
MHNQLEYRDDGAEINRDDKPHIFEPFCTSYLDRYAGLGLNTVDNLVKTSRMEIYSVNLKPKKE